MGEEGREGCSEGEGEGVLGGERVSGGAGVLGVFGRGVPEGCSLGSDLFRPAPL